jgi:hypothetical protein
MANPIKPTRAQLSQFLPDQRLIRAFEQLFDVVPGDIIVLARLIEEVGIEAVSAMARAESNSATLQRIAESLELILTAPTPQPQIDMGALELLLTAPIPQPPQPADIVVHTVYGHARYSSTVDQAAAVISTAYAVTFNTTQNESGVSLVSSSQVTVSSAGVFEVTVGIQALKSVATIQVVDAWLRLNGTDIIDSRMSSTVTVSGDTQHITNTYQVTLAASDYIQVMWATDSTSMTLDATAATAYGPTSPSASVSVKQIEVT